MTMDVAFVICFDQVSLRDQTFSGCWIRCMAMDVAFVICFDQVLVAKQLKQLCMTATMKFAKFHRCCAFDLACDDCLVVLEMVLWQGNMKGGGATCPKCGSPEVETENHSTVWRRVRRMKAVTLGKMLVKIATDVPTPTTPHPFRMPVMPGSGSGSSWVPVTPPRHATPATPETPRSDILDEIARRRLEPDPKLR